MNNDDARNFRDNVIHYNAACAFGSRVANLVTPPGRGEYSMTIHGNVYHYVGALNPPQGRARQYAQCYVIDSAIALQERMEHPNNVNCRPRIMERLDAILRRVNPYATQFMVSVSQ